MSNLGIRAVCLAQRSMCQTGAWTRIPAGSYSLPIHTLGSTSARTLTSSTKPSSPDTPNTPDSSATSLKLQPAPPKLEPPKDLAGKLRNYVQQGKQMMRQFWEGSKEYVKETKQAKELKRRKTVDGYEWTRQEYFLVKRNDQDFWRALPFMFCVVFLGEAIPFLLIRGIVPSTCMTVEQLEKRWRRLHEARVKISANAIQSVNDGEAVQAPAFLSDDFVIHLAYTQPQYFHLENLSFAQLREYNKFLGIWRTGPAPYLRRVLRKHIEYVKGDDLLLQKEGLDKLTTIELKWAMEARGLPSTDATPAQMRKDLAAWLKLHLNDDPAVPFPLVFFTAILRTGLHGAMQQETGTPATLSASSDRAVLAADGEKVAAVSGGA
ncbi:LETM1-like protein-domain-containing protein [Phlyctochytrium arcticum]|nr:LETM1-like protein-domain-containing protein [Phlyctochytrium arcticum]